MSYGSKWSNFSPFSVPTQSTGAATTSSVGLLSLHEVWVPAVPEVLGAGGDRGLCWRPLCWRTPWELTLPGEEPEIVGPEPPQTAWPVPVAEQRSPCLCLGWGRSWRKQSSLFTAVLGLLMPPG